MTSLRWPPPGGTRSKPGIRMTLTTVCAVLMVNTAGFTHVAYVCVMLKAALSVGITCLRKLMSGGGRKRSYGAVKLTCPKRSNEHTQAVSAGILPAEGSIGLPIPFRYLDT